MILVAAHSPGDRVSSVNRMDGAAWMEAVVLCMLQSISSGRKKMHSSMNNNS